MITGKIQQMILEKLIIILLSFVSDAKFGQENIGTLSKMLIKFCNVLAPYGRTVGVVIMIIVATSLFDICQGKLAPTKT